MSNLKKQIESLKKTLLDNENEVLVWAEETDHPGLLGHAASVLVHATKALEMVEKLADKKMDYELQIEADTVLPEDLTELAALATELDSSEDEYLQKQAAVIDQLIINFAQRGLRVQAESAEEKELAKLRAEYRSQARDKAYNDPRKEHEKEIQAEKAFKAIKDQIKEYRPMESSLSTRYCPDHPGSHMRRVGDYSYQCALDKKIYNWQEGFTTEKGNKVPGGDVSHQTMHLGDRALEEMHFSTREARLGQNRS